MVWITRPVDDLLVDPHDSSVLRVPADPVADEVQQLLRIELIGPRQEAVLAQQPVELGRVVLDHRALAGQLELGDLRGRSS